MSTMADFDLSVLIWWVGLSVVGVFNIFLWLYCRKNLAKENAYRNSRHRQWQLMLSGIYVFGCAFRSFLPRADVQRIVLVDSWLSSIFVGRTVATVAELCFMAQAALYLFEIASDVDSQVGVQLSKFIVFMIVAAEICSWYAILTTNYLGNSIEESIWTITSLFLLVGFFLVWLRSTGKLRLFLLGSFTVIFGYVVFMCTVDVPMYVFRWRDDVTAGRSYLDLKTGLWETSHHWVVTYLWKDWGSEMSWMSLYFSLAVWVSIALIYAPQVKMEIDTPPTEI